MVGDLLGSLLNHADRVRIACLAQLVNVIAPIRTEPGGAARRQTTFHPFAAVAAAARGVVLVPDVDCSTINTQRYGAVPAVTAAATTDETGAWSLFLTNRSDTATEVELELRGLADAPARFGCTVEAGTRTVDDVRSTPPEVTRQSSGVLGFTLPPESWTVLECPAR